MLDAANAFMCFMCRAFGCSTRNCFAFLMMPFSELPRLYPVSRNVVKFFFYTFFSGVSSLSIVVHNQTTGRLTSDYSLHRIYMNWPFSCQAIGLMMEKCHSSINAAQLKYFHLALVDKMELNCKIENLSADGMWRRFKFVRII